jgi:4-amino-4-deoxy-L-arabinose transferase-like glycosyltransferase
LQILSAMLQPVTVMHFPDNPRRPWPLILFFLALGPRLYELGGPSLAFYDELTTLARAMEPSLAGVVAGAARQYPPFIDFQPPLYYAVVHVMIWLFGHSDFFVRLPAALAGAACAPLLYLVGRRLGGKTCGIFAGAALAASLYHVEVSQQVRLYALYGFCILAGLLFLLRALAGGHRRDWLVFAGCGAAALYTSYLAAGFLVFAALASGLALVWPGDDAPPRRRTLLWFAGAMALILAAFAPWWLTTAGMRHFLLASAPAQLSPLLPTLQAVFAAFSSHYAPFLGRPELPWLVAGPAAAGLVVGLCAPARRQSAILVGLLFACTFALAWGRATTSHHFQVRYVLPCLFAALLAAGLGLSVLLDRLPARRAVHVLALLLGLALAVPNAPAAPFFYRRDDSRLKTLAAALDEAAAPRAALILWRESDPWTRPYFEVFTRWYLPGRFLPSLPHGGPDGRAAREALVLVPTGGDASARPLPEAATPVASLAGVAVHRLPLINTAPNLPTAAFSADFRPDTAFGEMAASRNLRATGEGLVLADRGRAGEATYAFTPLPGQTVALASLAMDARITDYPDDDTPTGRAFVLVGPDADSLIPYDPAAPPPPAKSLTVRLIMSPGFEREPVAVTRLDLGLTVSGDPGLPGAGAAERVARLAANTPVAPCPAGTAYPGQYVLDPTGRVCPWTVPVEHGAAANLGNAGTGTLRPGALVLEGNPGGASLMFGERAVSVPLAGPSCLTAFLTPGEEGEAVMAPLYTAEAFDAGAADAGATAVRLANDPALSCPDAKPCFVAYGATTGYPAKSLELTWFPRLFGDVAGQNGVVAEVALGDGDYRLVDAFLSTRSGRWDGLGVMRRATLDLDGFTGTVRLRFRLTGDGTQLWSAPGFPMAMSLTLDTRSLPALELAPGLTSFQAACPGQCRARLGFEGP